jgi:hypothetical protein
MIVKSGVPVSSAAFPNTGSHRCTSGFTGIQTAGLTRLLPDQFNGNMGLATDKAFRALQEEG